MKIEYPQDLLSILKNKHLLLDTNVFIDAFASPSEYGVFFNSLKENNTTLVTIKLVLIEFLKGAPTKEKQFEKRKFIDNIVDAYLPSQPDFTEDVLTILNKLGIESKASSLTDLVLGANLLRYKTGLFLLTKDLSDFPTNVFERITYITVLKPKTIQSFGVYNKIL